MNAIQEADIECLKSELKRIQKIYPIIQELCDQDFSSDDSLPETRDDMESCARLADRNGFDGNIFRNLYTPPFDSRPNYNEMERSAEKMIGMIPRIIANIEQPDPKDYSLPMPPGEWVKVFKIKWDALKKRNSMMGQFAS